jgi:hypothetical protein
MSGDRYTFCSSKLVLILHTPPAALYLRGKASRYPLDRRLGGPQSRYGCRG